MVALLQIGEEMSESRNSDELVCLHGSEVLECMAKFGMSRIYFPLFEKKCIRGKLGSVTYYIRMRFFCA